MIKNKLVDSSVLFLGTILAGIFIYYFSKSTLNPEEFGLGQDTYSYFAINDTTPIHINRLSKTELDLVYNGWLQDGKKEVLLVLGNSQTHGINHLKKGDVTYNQLLFKQLYPQYYTITHSLPNANMQEFLLSYAKLSSLFPIKKVILPIFFDDLREDGIRDVFFPLFITESFKINSKTQISDKINTQIAGFKTSSISNTDMKALNQTAQEITEIFLENKMSSNSIIWEARPSMRGEFFVRLYNFRNTVLGINAQTVRKSIPLRYTQNLHALDEIVAQAKDKNMEVFLYIPPIRNDVAIPYDMDEYQTFKKDLDQLVAKHKNVELFSFENIIPGKYWGMKNSTNNSGTPEYDFMHFQYAGHQILDSAIFANFNKKSK